MDPQAMQEEQMLAIAETIEQAVDDELARIDGMDDDDLGAIRRARRQQVAEMQKRKDLWISRGHGIHTEITDPKQFFEFAKGSERVVCHFKRSTTERCAVVERHMMAVARVHWETRFCCVDVEKVPSLPQQFNVAMLPTIMLVEKGNTFHSIIGFDDFGGRDDFTTDTFVKVLAHYGMVNDRDMFASDQSRDPEDD